MPPYFFSRKIQTFLLHIKAYDVIPIFDSCSNNNYNIEDIETYSMRFIILISKKIDSNNTQVSLITSMSALVWRSMRHKLETFQG